MLEATHSDLTLLRALVEGLQTLLRHSWDHEPSLLRLKKAGDEEDATGLQRLVDIVTRELNDVYPSVRLFWKDADLRWFGCCPRFALDAGKTAPDELVGLSDDSPGIPFIRQAAKYHRDDREVMVIGHAFDICERQDRDEELVVWIRTSKVALYDSTGVCGLVGAYDEVDAETAFALRAGRTSSYPPR